MKYIKINTTALSATPIVFPEAVAHSDFAERLCSGEAKKYVESAGFCYLRDGLWVVPLDRGSESLGISPADEDSLLLNVFMKPTEGMNNV